MSAAAIAISAAAPAAAPAVSLDSMTCDVLVDSTVVELVKFWNMIPTSDISKSMKAMATVMEKRAKNAETAEAKVMKMEEKRADAAPPKKVLPKQLAATKYWVEFVHKHILHHGWEAFQHKERSGKGMAVLDCPASERVMVAGADGVPFAVNVFQGILPHTQPNLSHAMSISTKYKTEKPELYAEWQASYVPPAEDAAVAAVAAVTAVSAKPAPVSMSLAEKVAAKAAIEAEKAERKAERERKKAAAEAEKAAKKEERERKKAAKAPAGVVVRAIVPAAKPIVAAVPAVAAVPTVAMMPPALVSATPAVAAPVPAAVPAAVAAVATPVAVPAAVPAAVAAVPAAVAAVPAAVAAVPAAAVPVWIRPEEGGIASWIVNGKMYLRDADDYLFEDLGDDVAEPLGPCVGKYYPETGVIDDSDIVLLDE